MVQTWEEKGIVGANTHGLAWRVLYKPHNIKNNVLMSSRFDKLMLTNPIP